VTAEAPLPARIGPLPTAREAPRALGTPRLRVAWQHSVPGRVSSSPTTLTHGAFAGHVAVTTGTGELRVVSPDGVEVMRLPLPSRLASQPTELLDGTLVVAFGNAGIFGARLENRRTGTLAGPSYAGWRPDALRSGGFVAYSMQDARVFDAAGEVGPTVSLPGDLLDAPLVQDQGVYLALGAAGRTKLMFLQPSGLRELGSLSGTGRTLTGLGQGKVAVVVGSTAWVHDGRTFHDRGTLTDVRVAGFGPDRIMLFGYQGDTLVGLDVPTTATGSASALPPQRVKLGVFTPSDAGARSPFMATSLPQQTGTLYVLPDGTVGGFFAERDRLVQVTLGERICSADAPVVAMTPVETRSGGSATILTCANGLMTKVALDSGPEP
jgi:hypothetical protein